MTIERRSVPAWLILFAFAIVAGCEAAAFITAPRRAALEALVTSQSAADDFNRADESPITGNWVSGPGAFPDLYLASGAVRGATFDQIAAAYYSAVAWPADQWSEVRLTGLGTSGGAGGVGVRVSATDQTAYLLGVGGAGTWFVLSKFVAGSYTEMQRTPLAFSAGDALRLEVQADTLRAFKNGVLIATLRDGSIASGNAGLVIYHNDAALRLDDWTGGTIGGNPPPPPPPPTPPAAPTSLTAQTVSSSAIHLSWTDNATDEQGFRIERCSGASCSTFAEIATTSVNAVVWDDNGLSASTSYTYRVRAYNGAGTSAYTNTATATTANATASDMLPDLSMARLANLSLVSVSGRKLLRYSTTIVNIGAGPYEVHGQRASTSDSLMSVVQRIHNDAGGWRDVSTPAVLVFGGDGHNHWHVKELEISELYRLSDGVYLTRSNKRGYCFWDNVQYRVSLPGAPQSPVYNEPGCGRLDSLSTNMGLSVGWGDIYPYNLPDQNIDVTGVADGQYKLVVTANPDGGFSEQNSSNNVTWVNIQLSHKGTKLNVLSYGPAAIVASQLVAPSLGANNGASLHNHQQ